MSEHPFARYIRKIGKGKTGSRSLNMEEAENAMRLLLAGEVTAEQVGAFLMLLRMKEETAEEIAGFVLASKTHIQQRLNSEIPREKRIPVDLDWPSYAGKRRQHPWYVLAALLLAHYGHRVLVHGIAGHTEGRLYTAQVLENLGIDAAENLETANDQLLQHSFSYLDLKHFCDPLAKMINLRPFFGLRSPGHTLSRLLNPFDAHASLQSVFHPSYSETHHGAAQLLHMQNSAVFKGEAGEAEYKPHAKVMTFRLQQGKAVKETLPRARETSPGDTVPKSETLQTLWQGGDGGPEPAVDELAYGEQAVIGTAALALLTMGEATSFEEATQLAKRYWETRDKSRLPATR